MDIANFGANFSMVREHLTLFALFVFATPLISFVSIKFWSAARASKSQRDTNWFVPTDFNSEAGHAHYGVGQQSLAFATARRHPRRSSSQGMGR